MFIVLVRFCPSCSLSLLSSPSQSLLPSSSSAARFCPSSRVSPLGLFVWANEGWAEFMAFKVHSYLFMPDWPTRIDDENVTTIGWCRTKNTLPIYVIGASIEGMCT